MDGDNLTSIDNWLSITDGDNSISIDNWLSITDGWGQFDKYRQLLEYHRWMGTI